MQKTRFLVSLVVGLCLAGPAAAINLDRAADYFGEARALCEKDGGDLWGVSLCGPMLFADPDDRTVVASEADAEGLLDAKGGVFVGRLGEDVAVANNALEWGGKRWTMLRWPLPEAKDARAVLLAHESFHRIEPQLPLPAASEEVDNGHLDSLWGRYYLRLEWRALARALGASGEERKQAVADALTFRFRRHAVLHGSTESERLLELHEGLAEHTGVSLAFKSPEKRARHVVEKLERAHGWPTFVRSFAYASGPAYGQLLDAADPGWQRRLEAASDLAHLLRDALEIEPPRELQAETIVRAREYGDRALWAEETARMREQRARFAAYRARLVEGPVLILTLRETQYSFDPLELEALGEEGTVYPTLELSDRWGRLKVEAGGALINPAKTRVQVSAPASGQARSWRGEGWTLELEPGWRLVPAKRQGDMKAVGPPAPPDPAEKAPGG